ncbi:MAG: hypothetical protein M3044_08800 [Thermoproteota archaeon]|nr:hypothetical protein [Thermoproteota archaeon]
MKLITIAFLQEIPFQEKGAEESRKTNIQIAEVTLRGTEFATAESARTTTKEQRNTNVNWNSNLTSSFNVQIPVTASKSYLGKYSKYYREIELYVGAGFLLI